MGMSGLYDPADEAESIATIHAALDAGITLLDTGDYYAAGHNELLIRRALCDRRDKALVSVKFGALRGPDGSWLGMDTRPIAVRNFFGVHPDAPRPSTRVVSAESHSDRYGEATLRFPSEAELGRDEHMRAEGDAGA